MEVMRGLSLKCRATSSSQRKWGLTRRSMLQTLRELTRHSCAGVEEETHPDIHVCFEVVGNEAASRTQNHFWIEVTVNSI